MRWPAYTPLSSSLNAVQCCCSVLCNATQCSSAAARSQTKAHKQQQQQPAVVSSDNKSNSTMAKGNTCAHSVNLCESQCQCILAAPATGALCTGELVRRCLPPVANCCLLSRQLKREFFREKTTIRPAFVQPLFFRQLFVPRICSSPVNVRQHTLTGNSTGDFFGCVRLV